MSPNYPAVDRNHLISNASKRALSLHVPSTWNYDDLDGDNDFGMDFQIQVALSNEVRTMFRAQLKGTESPSYSKDGKTLSILLRRTTLNLYANVLEPVMLLIAVVNLDADGNPDLPSSKVYWQWMDEELQRLRGSSRVPDLSSQDRVTVHVSTANLVTPGLDV